MSFAEVELYIWMIISPYIPIVFTLRKQIEIFLVCHVNSSHLVPVIIAVGGYLNKSGFFPVLVFCMKDSSVMELSLIFCGGTYAKHRISRVWRGYAYPQ